MTMMNKGAHSDEPRAAVFGEKQQDNQNPLRMLELLVKGFCPTVIRDRVEIHEQVNDQGVARTDAYGDMKATSGALQRQKSEEQASPANTRQHRLRRCLPAESPNESRPMSQLSSNNTSPEKQYFEIGERPPSDVIGISKKIWEGFCYNPYNDNTESSERRRRQTSSTQPLHKGFCGILVDQYRALCSDNDKDDGTAPEGEECSIDSSDDASSGGSLAVDLTPQSSSHRHMVTLSNGDKPPYAPVNEDIDIDFDGDCDCEEEGVEEEEVPMAEFLHTKPSYRGLQMLLVTFLAVYITFVLLQNLDTVQDKSFHFALERKEGNASARRAGLPIVLSVSRKVGRVAEKTAMLESVAASEIGNKLL